jgi:hypothetical protein
MIISVSRRCDIPRFQFEQFLGWLDAGFVETVNPFNNAQTRRVSLAPEEVDVLVFWTRDPRRVLEGGAELERRGFRFYLMCSLTGYPGLLEPNPPPEEGVIAALRGLSSRFGARRVIWRYDPILLSTLTDREFHIKTFSRLAAALRGAVRRVIISLYDPYQGAERRLKGLEAAGSLGILPLYAAGGEPLPGTRDLLAGLAAIAAGAGMEMQSCAEAALGVPGIRPGACIDRELIRELWGIAPEGRDRNQRPLCGCAPSVDIGRYGPCPGGCVYCYARR